MAIWPFNRRQVESSTPQNVPAEVSQYYQAERRDRTGLAWLLAGGTLVVTVLVALGLFFGGRTLYRHYHHQTISKQPASQPVQTKSTKPNSAASSSAPNNSSNSSSTPTTGSNQSTPLPRTGPDEDL